MPEDFHIEDLSNWNESDLVDALAHHSHFAYLDSSDSSSIHSQFSFIGVDPVPSGGSAGVGCPLHVPFHGGQIGFFTYDGAPHFRTFNKIVAINKKTNQTWYIHTRFSEPPCPFESLVRRTAPSRDFSIGPAQSNETRESYIRKIERAQQYIYEGDIYQVNLSHRYSAGFSGDPLAFYRRLRAASPAPYSAFLKFPGHTICSASPEQLMHIQNGVIRTRPIKGTIASGKHAGQHLSASEKDRAELIMIVDLERNDLGRMCNYGSVTVPELIGVEDYRHVSHLVSTIQGTLKPGLTPMQALEHLFPGGSITGAPKIRAMQIINELETVPRHIYTGAIGYIGFNGNADFNIAIRTAYIGSEAKIHFHTGGAITADSDPDSEWQETLTKAAGFFQCLEIVSPLHV